MNGQVFSENIDRDKLKYTLSADIREKFLKHIEDNNLNKSKLIETLIEEYMEKVKEIKN